MPRQRFPEIEDVMIWHIRLSSDRRRGDSGVRVDEIPYVALQLSSKAGSKFNFHYRPVKAREVEENMSTTLELVSVEGQYSEKRWTDTGFNFRTYILIVYLHYRSTSIVHRVIPSRIDL